jgi:predicted aconitase
VAWAESNAIVFCNSVLGARTDRYGDFVDVAAAITGRVPEAGLHVEEHRRGQVLLRLRDVPDRLLSDDVLYPALGIVAGTRAGLRVPVIDGLPPDTDEDRLKALGAGAASSGGVALFHAVGVTPEAPPLDAAFAGGRPEEVHEVQTASLRAARDELSTAPDGRLDAVSLGAPHLSVAEIERVAGLLDGRAAAPGLDLYLNTGRGVLQRAWDAGLVEPLERAGARFVVDTCTYITPIMRSGPGVVVMMNSSKAAYYAPGNLGLDVVFGSLEECVRSATRGEVWRDPRLWAD